MRRVSRARGLFSYATVLGLLFSLIGSITPLAPAHHADAAGNLSTYTSAASVTTLPAPSTITIGETQILTVGDNKNANLLLAQQATLPQTATIQSLSFYVTTASGNLRLGIYDATGPGGGPGAKKAETASFIPVAGWNTINVIAPVSLPPGNYYLAYFPSSNGLNFVKTSSGPTSYYYSLAFGAMPSTFSTSPASTASHWSLYATLNVAGGGDTIPPTIPTNLSATAVSTSQINLLWTASTDNVAVTGYKIFRCQGSACTPTVQVATSTGVSYADTGLTSSTSYTYIVSAYDAAGNASTPSASATAITLTPDTIPPSQPANLIATAISSSQIDLSWTPSTDNVGVTGYQVERCQGGGCANFVQVAAPTSPSYSDQTLTPNTTYVYRVRATDAAGNLSAYSSAASATTLPAPSTITIGETQIVTLPDDGNANLLLAQQATLAQTATIQSLSFYVTTASGNLRLGIYDATGPGGGPGTKKAETASFIPVAGWNTVNVIAPVSLPSGNYYLAYLPNSNGLNFLKINSGPISYYYSVTFGAMPSTFSTSPASTASHWSLYATLNVAGGGDTIPPSVTVTFPANSAQVSDIITITADASDNIGVVGVQFFVDGIATGAEDTTAPYGFNWDTRGSSNGAHTLTARARDAVGNSTLSTPVTVNVANTNFFQNEILATGFNLPLALKFLPDGRMLVVELPGKIKVLPPPFTTPDPTPFLDLGLNITGYAGLQQGIFDIALDPNFSANHYYYIFYTKDNPNVDRLSRFTANAALDGTIPGSELILYQDPQTANTEHHGGATNFGNDGKIYFTTGEHFNGPDAQNLSSPRGKVHRINPDGTVPTDNPFYDGAGPNWDSVWALGLRNPYRAYFDAPTNRLLIGDVGGNDYSVAKEEVNLGVRGANYGWPNSEGNCSIPCTSPLYFYPHNGRDAAITGGFVYHGTQFPVGYQGSYFFADYTQNWIRRLTFDGNGNVNGVFNFEPADGSLDGPYGDIVYLTEGPDGALYYVDLGYSDVGGTFGISKIRRIRYIQTNQAPVAMASSTPTSGPTPLTVNFSSAGSLDPEGKPITYLWTFGDSASSTVANPVHVYALAGQYTARLTVSDGVNSTLAPPLFISAGNKPTATILSPQGGIFFLAGDTISFNGTATDTEDGTLPASAFTWNIDFLHEGHVHPGISITGVTSGSFTIPTSGHDFSGFTRYRIMLTVTDSSGLQSSQSVIIYPSKVNLSFDTVPSGLTLYLDGIAKTAPFVYDTLVGFSHTIEAQNQSTATTTYTFQSWSDGGAQTHTITAPASAQSYTATYTATPNTTPITIGETTIFGGDDGGNGNLLLVQDATLSQAAMIQNLSFYVNIASGDLRLGIYDATGPGSGPGALKAQTNAFTPVVGWNSANVITPVSLPPGNYWLAYLPSSNGLHFATNFSIGLYKYAAFTFGPMPATFPTIAGQGTTHWSLYGTLTTP